MRLTNGSGLETHRLNGPAMVGSQGLLNHCLQGSVEYMVEGRFLSKEEFYNRESAFL